MLKFVLRGLAALILAVVVFIAIGGAMAAVAGSPALRGRLIEIAPEGQAPRRLHLVCAGPAASGDGGPGVWFEAGAFGLSADWGVVQDRLTAQGVRSCAYDRAGLGRSDPAPGPRDAAAVAADLEALIAVSGERGPFVMVGHSMAGLHVRLFTGRNPRLVAGAVLVDAATPEAALMPQVRRFVDAFAQSSRLAGAAASIGLFKPLRPFGDRIGLEGSAREEKRRAFASGAHNRAAAAEVVLWAKSSEQAAAAAPYDPDLPVAVITAGPADGARAQWKAIQSGPGRASRRGYVENVPAAGHADLLGLRHADGVLRGIAHVRAAVMAPAADSPPQT